MKIFETWKRRNPEDKKNFKRTDKTYNFYGIETIGKQTTRFNFVHYKLKYKIIIPGILLIKKIFGKKILSEVPDKPQFEWIAEWSKNYKQAIIKWGETYHQTTFNTKNNDYKKRYETDKKSSFALLRTINELLITITTNDNAYAELIPFIMKENYNSIQQMMNEGRNKHLLHTVKGETHPSYELIYLALQKTKYKNYIQKEVGRQ